MQHSTERNMQTADAGKATRRSEASIGGCGVGRKHQGPWRAPAERLAHVLGLSTAHISPRGNATGSKYACQVAVGGALMSVHGRRLSDRAHQSSGIRGEVQGFSNGSRRRLMRKIASVDREAVGDTPIFVTLTYPGEWPADPQEWKKHLDTFGKRLLRRYPAACAIWKLEPQKRGAPHFHLIVLNVPHVDKHWLAHAWYEIVDSGDVRHLRAGTRVESIRTWRGCMAYASKYTAKVIEELPPGWERVGRMWGIIGRKNLPISVVRFEVTKPQFLAIRDFLWDVVGGPPPGWIQFADDGMTAIIDWDEGSEILKAIIDGETYIE